MNKVNLIGNVGREVNVMEFENGKKASFSLATNESYTNRNNEEVTNTAWHNVIAWGKVAQQCEQMLSKGKFIQVEGKITYREYQNRENQTVKITEIVALKVEEGPKKAA